MNLQRVGRMAATSTAGCLNLSLNSLQVEPVRHARVSTKYFKRPWPRNYRLRLVQEVMKPILPSQVYPKGMRESCTLPTDKANQELPEVEREINRAHALHVRECLQDYRVMAICQELDAGQDFKTLQTRKMRPMGIDMQQFPNDVMREAIRDTRLSTLIPMFSDGANTTLLLAATPRSLAAITQQCNQLPFLHLLACVVDNRIFTRAEVEQLAIQDLESLPAQTVAILQSIPENTAAILQQAVSGVSRSLSAREDQLNNSEEKPKK